MKTSSTIASLALLLTVSTSGADIATLAHAEEPATPSPDRNAQWIWSDENGPGNSWRCFWKDFKLNAAPDKAPAKIAADS